MVLQIILTNILYEAIKQMQFTAKRRHKIEVI